MNSANSLLCCTLGLVVCLLGCNAAPPPIEPPAWKPAEQAAAAMKLYDKNNDGKIDSSEQSPGLKAALASIDTDGDKSISAAELEAKIQSFADSQLGKIGVSGLVSNSGRKVPGATVKFIPEPFLADVISPASGTVDESGYYSAKTEGQELEAVSPGIYRVEISMTGSSANEQIPARYNEETELGVVIEQAGAQSRGASQYDWNL